MPEAYRIGVLGAGAFASRRHLPALQSDPRARVVAACRRDPEALATFADHFHIPDRYTNWEAMLNDAALDGVLIATPHDQHYAQAKAALECGLHVLMEKPMALSGEEAKELADLAHLLGRSLVVAFNPPYWRHTNALRAGIAAGRVGDLESVDIRISVSAAAVFGKAPMPETMPGVVRPTLFRADPAANGGGNLMDGGGHLFSELLWVTGRAPLAVSALMDTTPDDMRAVLLVRLEGNLLATITAVADSAYQTRRIRSTYDGSQGTAIATGLPYQIVWRTEQGDETLPESNLPDIATPVSDWLDGFDTGHGPLGSPEHGVQVTRLLAAAYESARLGRVINV
ncbi:oxidoreductase [Capsulimonas corticalis]|uniref:Oxidoreductase n=1 Tax=Capsulimonas corticalis TaxID=2219043 RepID=A0A402CNV6_9BACT|nr:Gfo/Idh/MocA family oxidoreductase [Capsulimonas corticalis]BDI33217.1 oxidoreductase [Capsulimonas corticalis]